MIGVGHGVSNDIQGLFRSTRHSVTARLERDVMDDQLPVDRVWHPVWNQIWNQVAAQVFRQTYRDREVQGK